MAKITTRTIEFTARNAEFFELMGRVVTTPGFDKALPYFKDEDGKAWTFAFVDGELAGMAGIRVIPKGKELCNLYVKPEFAEAGVDTALIAARLDAVAEEKLVRVTCPPEVMEHYDGKGFKPVAKKGKYTVIERKAQK